MVRFKMAQFVMYYLVIGCLYDCLLWFSYVQRGSRCQSSSRTLSTTIPFSNSSRLANDSQVQIGVFARNNRKVQVPILNIKNAIYGFVTSSTGPVMLNPFRWGEQQHRRRRGHRKKHRWMQQHQCRLGWWLGQVAVDVSISLQLVIKEG